MLLMFTFFSVSKFVELLLRASRFGHFQHVESYSLAEGPALANGHDIANSHISVEKRIIPGLVE